MYKDMLPIGSVVLLRGGEKRVMICGRITTCGGSDEIYDYSACYFPEGIIGSDKMVFFNRNDIDRIFFLGFQDPESLAFQANVLDNLGELEVRDGRIVQKVKDI